MTSIPITKQRRRRKLMRSLNALLLSGVLAACADDAPSGPGEPADEGVFVLNSTGQTLAAFSVGETLRSAETPIDLGAGFDGDAFDHSAAFAVTTVSSFGGSRVLFVDLDSGDVLTSLFPEPEADLANPSVPSFDEAGTVWVGGRYSDAVYRLDPGDPLAQKIADGVGTFIERVVPVGQLLYAVDANIDDDGGTYQPLGPGRIVVLSRTGLPQDVVELPGGALNPTDALEVDGKLIVLAAGTFDPGTFQPLNDGALAIVDLDDRTVDAPLALAANGVSLELGADGFVYVTATSDFNELHVLRFDPTTGSFDRGPDDPIDVRGPAGERVECWSATAVRDGRILCLTFSFAEAGRLVLTDSNGAFIDEMPSGFGSTDLGLR